MFILKFIMVLLICIPIGYLLLTLSLSLIEQMNNSKTKNQAKAKKNIKRKKRGYSKNNRKVNYEKRNIHKR